MENKSGKIKKKITVYLILFAAGLVLSAILTFTGGAASAGSGGKLMKILSDAFTIPGFVYLAAGLLMLVVNMGGFDGLLYMNRKLRNASKKRNQMPLDEEAQNRNESYADFIRRREKQEKSKIFKYPLVNGIVFILVAVIFSLLYRNA